MFFDIFASFDDHNGVVYFVFLFVWLLGFFFSSFCFLGYWVFFGFSWLLFFSFVLVVDGLVSRSLSFLLGGSLAVFSSLFILLVLFNLLGLVPYVFSSTSHLAVNFSLAFPIWLMGLLSSVFYDFSSFVAHLQPLGSPAFLNPFLCVIELVSLLVRPLTLSVRLTANLSTGHILMSLLGGSFVGVGLFLACLVLFVGVFYSVFESAVCFIQAYIFTLLPSLYFDEHPVS